MAGFNTIIAREGCTEEMALRFSESKWDRPVVTTEADARELAGEKFESDAMRSEWEVAPDSIAVFEIDGKDESSAGTLKPTAGR